MFVLQVTYLNEYKDFIANNVKYVAYIYRGDIVFKLYTYILCVL